MKKFACTFALLIGLLSCRANNPGDEVVVVYNSRLPASKAVAEHYAERRQVPTNQVFGLDLSTSEEISRAQFNSDLLQPLEKIFERNKLWVVTSRIIAATNGQPDRVEWRPSESKIRYLVLCYGVPLRIANDPSLVEPGKDTARPEQRRNDAAVDSELALLPTLERKYDLGSVVRNWAYGVTNTAALNPTNGLLMVARLDGPTPEIARKLVDKAIEAETYGLWGRAYFDTRSITLNTPYKMGDNWISAAAEISRLAGYEVVCDTNEATFSAGFPMSQIALYAGWYDGDASGPFARPEVEFMPGAFAYHIHSYNAATLRSATRNWAGPLLAKGVTCTFGSVNEPYLPLTPDLGVFFSRWLIQGFTFGEAAYACSPALSWQTTVIGDPLYRPTAKAPPALHFELEKSQNPLAAWSHLKVVDLNLAKKMPLATVTTYLENVPMAKTNAVLQEKLGDLYAALGKPASTLRAYQTALASNPSAMQRLRLRLALGEQLQQQDKPAEAVVNYRALLAENPDYPDRQTLSELISKLGSQPSDPPPPPATNTPAYRFLDL